MKRIFTLSALPFLFAILFAGCVKDYSSYPPSNGEQYWLSQERGEVVYSDSYCNYYVVETYYGYTIIRSTGGYKPYEGSVLYGNFSRTGTRDFYNRSTGYIFSGTITDYWLSYGEAQYALDYYCPIYYGKDAGSGTTATREFKKSSFSK